MKLLLFDIDGTILLTGGAGVRGMEQAGVLVFGDRFSLREVSVAGGLDPLIYAEAALLAGIENAHEHHERFRDAYLEQLQRNLDANGHNNRLLPGVASLLETLRGRADVTLGLVTGNYTSAIPIKLRAVGLDPERFPVSAFGDEAPNRPALVRLAMARHRERTGRMIDPRDVIIIGDTPHDITCAHANGCLCFAVATGRYTVDELRAVGADVVVPDLSNPQPLFELLEK